MDSASLPQRLARMSGRSAELQLCAKQLLAASLSLLLASCGRESAPAARALTNDSPDQLLSIPNLVGLGTNGSQPNIFAEGLALFGKKLFQLTYLNGKCFVYDLQSFSKQQEFTYSGEGWGLTTDGQSLIMSDGSSRLRIIDPDSFTVKKIVAVTAAGRPLNRLNELEYIKGEVFANIWQTDFVARIDPASGNVIGLINFTGLLPPAEHDPSTDVLNGIAYDPASDRLFVTGKRWPRLFEVRLQRK